MKPVALLTCENLDDYVTDETALENALTQKKWSYEWVPWKEDRDWSQYSAVVVRTTWDYTRSPDQFLKKMEAIAKLCPLWNPIESLRWNADKIYLQDLESKGVSVIPTQFIEMKRDFSALESMEQLRCDGLVIKPRVGAGAWKTHLVKRGERLEENTFDDLLGVQVMVQPFMESVQTVGEYSAHFFAGEFSHCVLKKPKQGDFRSQEEFNSHIEEVPLSAEHVSFCKQVLSKVESPLLFARVDFLLNDKKNPVLIELELIEPSLYFRFKPGSADLMVEAMEKFIL